MKTVWIVSMVLTAAALIDTMTGAGEVKPVTLEIASGDAKAVIVTNAVIWHPTENSGGWRVNNKVDGLIAVLGDSEITIPWDRIKSVTRTKKGLSDVDAAKRTVEVAIEFMSGETQFMRLNRFDYLADYIEGETSLGKFRVEVWKIRTIRNIKVTAESKDSITKQ